MNGIPHLTKHDDRVLHLAVRPAGAPAKKLTRWQIAIVLLLTSSVCFGVYRNFDSLNYLTEDPTFGDIPAGVELVVKFVRQHQWQLYTYCLLALTFGQLILIKHRDRLIAKLYWHIVKLRKTEQPNE